MRAWVLGIVLSGAGFAQTAAPLPVDGKDLKVVPGPIAGTEHLRDLAPRMGDNGMDLQMRRGARRTGTVPAVAVPPGDVAITHQVTFPAGWQAYQVEAAPGEKIKARLRGDHAGWFVVRCVTHMGQLEKGMLQNLIHTGNPEASYINPRATVSTVYFVVDTTEMITGNEPYTVTFTREPAAGK
jgi:hypothetical protein